MRKQLLCLCVMSAFFLCSCHQSLDEQHSNHTMSTTANSVVTSTATANQSTTKSMTNAETTITDNIVTTSSSSSSQSVAMGTSATSLTASSSAAGSITTTQTVEQLLSTTTPSIDEPETITFRATVRENGQNKTVADITVTVYTNGNSGPAGSGVTDRNGVAHITLLKSNSYRVTLGNLPTGYEANSEYIFTSQTVNITIRKAAVQNEFDHSQAQYAVGKKMTNFTLTDTDGNTYKLYDLLKENQLVVLDFWYTTCEPCKSEFPYFEAVANKYNSKMKLLAIDPIDNTNAITRLRNQLKVTFPMMKDTCNLYLGFGVYTYPTTVFIDSSGMIMDIHIGAYESESAFSKTVERYLH